MDGDLSPGSAALRRGRTSQVGGIYLVTAATHGRRPYFRNDRLAREVPAALRFCADEAGTLCFVVMPDHVHWLLQLRPGGRLSAVVGKMKRRCARQCNRRLGTTGAFWQGGFHDRALRRDDDLVDIARYVVANPLRAGLVQRIGDYPHWDAVWVGDREAEVL